MAFVAPEIAGAVEGGEVAGAGGAAAGGAAGGEGGGAGGVLDRMGKLFKDRRNIPPAPGGGNKPPPSDPAGPLNAAKAAQGA